jgi:hypothetical protein
MFCEKYHGASSIATKMEKFVFRTESIHFHEKPCESSA